MSWTHSEACSIPPDYYPSEYNSENSEKRNLVSDSATIITGHFLKRKKNKPLKFKIRRSIEPDKNPLFFKTRKVKLLDVKNIYFSTRKEIDDYQFTDASTLEALLDYYAGHPVEPMVSTYLVNYWGGPIAGIYHGSDCERFVQIYEGEEYILFLDDDNTINARFTLPTDSKEILRAVTTLLEKLETNAE